MRGREREREKKERMEVQTSKFKVQNLDIKHSKKVERRLEIVEREIKEIKGKQSGIEKKKVQRRRESVLEWKERLTVE